jgi:hypothetical protein
VIIAGLICLAIAAGAAVFAYFKHREHRELTAVETSTCGELRELADAVASEVGGGNFSQRCEVVGAAKPSGAVLQAPYSNKPAVWYRTKVSEEYYDWETRGTGENRRRERVRKWRTLQDEQSHEEFLVDDGTGTAVITTKDVDVDEPHESFEEYVREPSGSFWEGLASSFLQSDDRIGLKREEWIVPPDARLFVQGEVTDAEKTLRIRKPEKGKFRVSLRSEEELSKSAASGKKWGGGGAGVFAIAGVVLIVVGLITG